MYKVEEHPHTIAFGSVDSSNNEGVILLKMVLIILVEKPIIPLK